jgi:putative membrane protein
VVGSAACEPETTPPPGTAETTAAAASTFTAGDTFGALRVIHAVELEHGRLAERKATDPRVRAFAEQVVADHLDRMDRDDQLMRSLHVKPRRNRVCNWLESVSDRRVARLDALSGSDFDRAYLEEQISYYRSVLDTFDKDLTPSARNPRLRAGLDEAIERANGHLREAEALQTELARPAPSMTERAAR